MLRWIVYIMLPGLTSSALKRYTRYNIQTMTMKKITQPDAKYWMEKYFGVNDLMVEKMESLLKTKKD
jgi:hypothetical protein